MPCSPLNKLTKLSVSLSALVSSMQDFVFKAAIIFYFNCSRQPSIFSVWTLQSLGRTASASNRKSCLPCCPWIFCLCTPILLTVLFFLLLCWLKYMWSVLWLAEAFREQGDLLPQPWPSYLLALYPILDTRISFVLLLLRHAQGTLPRLWNRLDWRALVKARPPIMGKLRE